MTAKGVAPPAFVMAGAGLLFSELSAYESKPVTVLVMLGLCEVKLSGSRPLKYSALPYVRRLKPAARLFGGATLNGCHGLGCGTLGANSGTPGWPGNALLTARPPK